jgi:serine O-acetyltransferase
MFEVIREDIRVFNYNRAEITVKLCRILFGPGLHAVLLYRLSRWFYLHHMSPLSVLIGYFNSILTGAQISFRAVIGKGLVIYHPHGIVIGPHTVIGDYCTLSHENLIGQLYGEDDRPVIGNYFYAGTGAKLLGKIEIGDHVRVGANAVITHSLPEGVTVAPLAARTIVWAKAAPQTANNAAASRTAIRQRLLPLLTSIIGVATTPDAVDDTTPLLGRGLGVDSIDLLRLLGAIEEVFHLTVPDSVLNAEQFQTVGSLITFICEKLLQ